MPLRRDPFVWELVAADPDGPWFNLTARCPRDFHIVWQAALERAHRDGIRHAVPEIEAFQLLEMLVADYLAGP